MSNSTRKNPWDIWAQGRQSTHLTIKRTDETNKYYLLKEDALIEREGNPHVFIKLSPEDFNKYLAKAKLTGDYARVYAPLIKAMVRKEADQNEKNYGFFIDEFSGPRDSRFSDSVDALSYALLENRIMAEATKKAVITSTPAISRPTFGILPKSPDYEELFKPHGIVLK